MIKTLYPCFQHWSAKGSVYLISDTHFEDEDRPYMGYNISEQEQIDILKQYCHKNDTLIHLGDVGNPEWMDQLRCYKVLIMGNHDQSIQKFEPHFNEVYPGPLMIADKILLSHEPIVVYHFALNIHGHEHSPVVTRERAINLASNVINFKPANLKEIIQSGWLKDIKSVHRQTIDKAAERKELRRLKDEE